MSVSRTARRGVSLILVMIVVVVLTILVAGAITFTGSERTAAISQTRSELLSGCAQAARNLFLANVRVMQGNAGDITFNQDLTNSDQSGMTLASRHYPTDAGVLLKNVTRLPANAIGTAGGGVQDLSNRVGNAGLMAGYYSVTALCQEVIEGDGGTEQEIEFVVRLGL